MRKNDLHENRVQLAIALNNLGLSWKGLKKYKQAKEAFEEAIQTQEQLFGEENVGVSVMVGNLALTCSESGDLVGAKKLFEKSLTIQEKCHGEKSPELIVLLQNFSELLEELRAFEEAKVLNERIISIQEITFGNLDTRLAQTYKDLGFIYEELKNKEMAKECYEKAIYFFEAKIEGLDQEQEQDQDKVSNESFELVDVNSDEDSDYDDVNEDRPPAQLQTFSIEDLELYALLYLYLGNINLELGKSKEAVQNFEKVISLNIPNQDIFVRALSRLGKALISCSEIDQGIQILTQVLDVYYDQDPKTDFEDEIFASSLKEIGNAWGKKGNKEKQLHYFKETFNVLEKIERRNDGTFSPDILANSKRQIRESISKIEKELKNRYNEQEKGEPKFWETTTFQVLFSISLVCILGFTFVLSKRRN